MTGTPVHAQSMVASTLASKVRQARSALKGTLVCFSTTPKPLTSSGDPGVKQAFSELGLRELGVVRTLIFTLKTRASAIETPLHRSVQTCSVYHLSCKLNLQEWQARRVRVRQHVNPFKKSLQIKHGPLPWAEVFKDPLRPMVVDVGCGYGRFLLQLARTHPQYNCLGLEIREPTVDRAKRCFSLSKETRSKSVARLWSVADHASTSA
jgi:hypothetical protein